MICSICFNFKMYIPHASSVSFLCLPGYFNTSNCCTFCIFSTTKKQKQYRHSSALCSYFPRKLYQCVPYGILFFFAGIKTVLLYIVGYPSPLSAKSEHNSYFICPAFTIWFYSPLFLVNTNLQLF